MDLDERITKLVRQVKAAVQASEVKNAKQGMRVGEIQLELKTVFSYEGGLSVKLLKLVDIGADVGKENVQTLAITLIPEEGVRMMESLEESLVEGIAVIRRAVEVASATSPAFDLKEATVTINLGVTADGSIKVFVGGGTKWESTQTVKLQLLPTS